MPSAPVRTLRYLRTWLTGRADLESRELMLDRDGTAIPATLLAPRNPPTRPAAWVVLHGITRPGRAHRQLVRFTRSLASAGFSVIVPEVPEWRELQLSPGLTVPTVEASLNALESGRTSGASLGLLGFSFGSPQAIAASGHERLRGRFKAVVGFGGYCDLARTVVFQFTGQHRWDGLDYELRPDPYGRWIVGANYLTVVPGLEHADAVAEGLRTLAGRAGDLGIMSWDPALDPTKDEIRRGLSGGNLELFDLFAPPASEQPDPEAARELSYAMVAAGRRIDPEIEPAPYFSDVRGPVHILHGRHDHLIPFSEAHRLAEALPDGVDASKTVTPLFGHSAQDPRLNPLRVPAEGWRFGGALSRILGAI